MTTTSDILGGDPTEAIRRQMIEQGMPEEDLAAVFASGGDVWSTEALKNDFEVLGFMAPLVIVKRRSDGVKGSLEFTHRPRWYFNWKADT
jgi:hypothetical protein